VAQWNEPEYAWCGARVCALGEVSLDFYGRAEPPAECVDFRIYLPRLLADYADRGGAVELLAPDVESVTRLSGRHDLVVVATGGRSVAGLFPRDPGNYQLCPGVADIFCPRFLHPDGLVHGIRPDSGARCSRP